MASKTLFQSYVNLQLKKCVTSQKRDEQIDTNLHHLSNKTTRVGNSDACQDKALFCLHDIMYACGFAAITHHDP
jgi:hypothetical protein